MRLSIILVLGFSILACADSVPQDMSRQLEPAQKLLADEKYDEAYDEYLRFAEEDNALAQFTIGMFHKLGWGRDIDEGKACDWFEKAAERDIPAAQHYFALYLLDGKHRDPDPARAADMFQEAGNLGHYLSYFNLGKLYLEGRGVPKDPKKGIELCRMAADHGVPASLVPTAKLLLEADPATRDPAAAWGYFERAATGEKPDPEAEYMLGVMARDGLGVPQNHDVAHQWLEMSASRGHLPAYLPCAEEFLKPHHGQKPSGEHIAKAYVWASAAVRRLDAGDEKQRATAFLDQVLTIMPKSWCKELDKKIEEHLESVKESDS